MKNSAKIFIVSIFMFVLVLPVFAQGNESENSSVVVVQPGAPGEATKTLPPGTSAILPKFSTKDIEFMQGMIHHHGQAVEMVALMSERTKNVELLRLGARISQSQADEIELMKRWLEARGQKTSMDMPGMKDMSGMKETSGTKENSEMPAGHHHHQNSKQMLMPGMLSPEQMQKLAEASGLQFDRLFLSGMIQHHKGALVMVDELFKTRGAGQDAVLFSFATDVDGSQRAEIRIMQKMLEALAKN